MTPFDRTLLDKIPDALKAGFARAQDAVEHGVSFVRSSLSGLPLLSSVIASGRTRDVARDETHYFLVPYRVESCGYVLFAIKRVPEGYGTDALRESMKLPKVRVFHLPLDGAEKQIERMVMAGIASATAAPVADGSPALADRLRTMADEIDKQSGRVTGGLVVIGGIAAIANPLLGVAIAAKALLPSVGAAASREGLRHVADRVSAWAGQRKEREQKEKIEAEYRAGGEVLTVVNPLLQALEQAVTTTEQTYDPLLRFNFEAFAIDGWDRWEMLKLSCHVVDEVYREVLDDERKHVTASLGPEDVRWLGIVRSYARQHGEPAPRAASPSER